MTFVNTVVSGSLYDPDLQYTASLGQEGQPHPDR